jgi:hypothetical protein
MPENNTDPVKALAEVLLAADVHAEAEDDRVFCEHVARLVLAAIRAHTGQGADLRASMGLELSETTRMGKHLRAAMDAFTTSERQPQ